MVMSYGQKQGHERSQDEHQKFALGESKVAVPVSGIGDFW
jgi:hypothetical protein